MKARTVLLTLTAAALISAPAAMAQTGPGDCDGTGPHGSGIMGGPGGHGGHGGHGFLRMLPRVADKIGLSDEQLDRIQTIVETYRPTLEALHEDAVAEREAFRDTYGFGSYDETVFRDHFDSQADLHVEMKLIGARMTSEVWSILTSEQQEELLELIELFKPGEGRGGKRHGGGTRYGGGN
jgi:Spy/CpxP family protein refolding chaperone